MMQPDKEQRDREIKAARRELWALAEEALPLIIEELPRRYLTHCRNGKGGRSSVVLAVTALTVAGKGVPWEMVDKAAGYKGGFRPGWPSYVRYAIVLDCLPHHLLRNIRYCRALARAMGVPHQYAGAVQRTLLAIWMAREARKRGLPVEALVGRELKRLEKDAEKEKNKASPPSPPPT
jgi:hypothetical protein